jgi:hypothetical protein
MNSELTEDDFNHPLFISPVPYLYSVTYRTSKRNNQVIAYTSPHEIILNLYCFKDSDKISYADKETGEDLFTISVARFKYMLSESVYHADQNCLETLYMRLLLVNRYSRTIADRGRFRQFHYTLTQFLWRMKGGYDIFLTTDRLRTILFAKARRLSCLHILAAIEHWNKQNDIHLNHLNLPTSIPDNNRSLLYECLRVDLTEKRFRLHSYTPADGEEVIFPTEITSELTQVINQLIK